MHLKRLFDEGEFAVLAEMEPPKGVDISTMVTNAAKVKGRVDAFVVPEMSNAVMRMSALGGAMTLQSKGMETVMQVCCRDRNRIALQADLLAAYACGITNIMAVTGEDPSFGDHHNARSVYDIDLMELLRAIRGMEQGRDMAGIELAGSPKFLLGSSVAAGTEGMSPELGLEEMEKKIDNGARFFITPALFDLEAVKRFRGRVENRNIKIIPTVLLLKSLGMARYIARNMDHIYLPDSVIKRIQGAPDKVRECTRIAAETVAELKQEGFAGVHLVTMGWEHKLSELLDKI
jgi:5,10-methylenetetrahydrofolate reductase